LCCGSSHVWFQVGCSVSPDKTCDLSRRYPKSSPTLRVAGEQQHLVPLRCVVQHALHQIEPLAVGVDECVVEQDQRRLAGLLQQVGIGQTADERDLLSG